MAEVSVRMSEVSQHVVRLAVPTPTLPPSYETNTYIVFNGDTGILVDAGTKDTDLLEQVVQTVRGLGIQTVTALLATHYHRDHTQGLPYLKNVFRTDIYLHPLDIQSGAKEMGIQPTEVLPIPAALDVAGTAVRIVHAPGHTHGHVHIIVPSDSVILVGDHLAGDGSVWIGPPDGHMVDYYAALNAISQSGCQIAAPGHGDILYDAKTASLALRERRLARESQLVSLCQTGPRTLQQLLDHLYRGNIPESALWVAKRTVQAHLQHLVQIGKLDRLYNEQTQTFYYTLHEND